MFLLQFAIQAKNNSFADQQLRYLDLADDFSKSFVMTSIDHDISRGNEYATATFRFKAPDPHKGRAFLTDRGYKILKFVDLNTGQNLPLNKRQRQNHQESRRRKRGYGRKTGFRAAAE